MAGFIGLSPCPTGIVVAILGAESTGKSSLARGLSDALAREGHDVTWVTEALREFCDAAGRTPHPEEQEAILNEQTRRIDDAARRHALVIADTTGLMTTLYSEYLFGDDSLLEKALEAQRRCQLTLLTALDLPWQPDGLRDGPHTRPPVDTAIRRTLQQAGLPFSVVSGTGDRRLASALGAVRHMLARRPLGTDTAPARQPRWQWRCERCGDNGCERRLLASTDR